MWMDSEKEWEKAQKAAERAYLLVRGRSFGAGWFALRELGRKNRPCGVTNCDHVNPTIPAEIEHLKNMHDGIKKCYCSYTTTSYQLFRRHGNSCVVFAALVNKSASPKLFPACLQAVRDFLATQKGGDEELRESRGAAADDGEVPKDEATEQRLEEQATQKGGDEELRESRGAAAGACEAPKGEAMEQRPEEQNALLLERVARIERQNAQILETLERLETAVLGRRNIAPPSAKTVESPTNQGTVRRLVSSPERVNYAPKCPRLSCNTASGSGAAASISAVGDPGIRQQTP
jgi:hypothetical protein